MSVADIFLYNEVKQVLAMMHLQSLSKKSAKYFMEVVKMALAIKYPSVKLWLESFESDPVEQEQWTHFSRVYLKKLFE